MKSEVKLVSQATALRYPAFYQASKSGLIVMFTELQAGIAITSSIEHAVGHFSSRWVEHTDADAWTRLPIGAQVILTQE